MSETSKLSPDTSAAMDGGSMIERAMRGRASAFATPPVPTDLLPAALRPVPAAAPVAAPAVPSPVAAPAPAPAAAAVSPAPVAAAQPAPAQSRAAPRQNPPHHIDRQKLLEGGFVCPDGGATAQLEEFRIVKRKLLEQAATLGRLGGGQAARRIMITSAHPGEGKTSCALNLALSITAERDSEVLLVDFDVVRASVCEAMGLPKAPGLMDALVDPAIDVRSLIVPTDIPRLSVLPGGMPTSSDSEFLAASRGAAVLDLLTDGAPNRIVLFDTPPVLAASIPAELAKLVGQTVMVVLADSTAQGSIKDGVQLLAGCPNIQLLLNAVHFSPSGRRFGSYYGYRG